MKLNSTAIKLFNKAKEYFFTSHTHVTSGEKGQTKIQMISRNKKGLIFIFVFGILLLLISRQAIDTFNSRTEALLKRGNMLWYNTPSAIKHKNDIYVAWMTTKREIVVGKFSPGKNTAQILSKHRYLDDHGVPVLHLVRHGPDTGKLRVFYNLHNSDVYMKTSNSPGELDFPKEAVAISSGQYTYPAICTTNDRLLLFYRKISKKNDIEHRPYYFCTSLDEGKTFSDDEELIAPADGEWIYSIPSSNGSGTVINLLFGVAVNKKVQNVYHIRSTDSGKTWTENNERPLSLPINPAFLAPVFRTSKGRETRVWSVHQNKNNEVAAIWIDYDEKSAIAYWSQYDSSTNKWKTQKITEQGLVYYPAGAAIASITPPTCYVSIPDEKNIHRIQKMVLKSGQWIVETESRQIPIKPEHHQVRPTVVTESNGSEFISIGVRSYNGYQDFDTYLQTSF